jgi:PAS domain-containing protein
LNDLKETILKLIPKQSTGARNDLLLIIIIVGAVLWVGISFDVFDKLVHWFVKEQKQADVEETIFVLFLLSLAVAIFSWRRWRELVAAIKIRKQVEEALKRSEEKYEILTETSQTGIYIHQDDKIVYANKKFAELHGSSKPLRGS